MKVASPSSPPELVSEENPPASNAPEGDGERPRVKFGTFSGVFTPTLLTILGVIMYLRLGWVVGNGGILGAFAIMAIAIGITAFTGLSLSSIATNSRLGAGGPYAIISKSLGLEVGGSIGVPLFLSQALAVAMYIFGLREGWNAIFPDHNGLVVDLVAFVVIFGIAYASANLAFKLQYVVMAIIVGSLVAIVGTKDVWTDPQPIQWWGTFMGSQENGFSGVGFWVVFAVFFPAATGVMAGANMSGDLKNPRKSIPVGTLAAIAISTVVYFALAVWCALAAPPQELAGNYNLMIERSLFPPLVIAGLLGATFSSALSSIVGAPRILMALAGDGIVPGGSGLAKASKNGEPRRAMLATGVIVLGALLLRDLNVIAPLISMFFLITYTMINVVVLIESSLGQMSFRPTLRVNRLIPALGAGGCAFAMFIVNPTFSLVSVAVVVAIFVFITKRRIATVTDDARSGLFVAAAGYAAAKVAELNIGDAARSWKPNLLVPVEDGADLRGDFQMILDIVRPEGSVKVLGLATEASVEDLEQELPSLARSFQRHGVFTTQSTVDSAGFHQGLVTGMQALRSAFFRPNILFVDLPEDVGADEERMETVREFRRLNVGVMLQALHGRAGLGGMESVNLWVRPGDPARELAEQLSDSNGHLATLAAYRIHRAWRGTMRIISVAASEEAAAEARAFLDELCDLARLPDDIERLVLVGDFLEQVGKAPTADLDVVGFSAQADLSRVRSIVAATRSSCLFTADSGVENAFA